MIIHNTNDYPAREKLFKLAMKNAEVIRKSYEFGWVIDKEKQAQIAKKIKNDIESVEAKIFQYVPQDINLNSPQQMAKFFFGELGESPRGTTKTGAVAFDEAVKAEIALKGQTQESRQLAEWLIFRSKAHKLQTSYIDNLKDEVVLRPQARVNGQVTGRTGYNEPALQTIPSVIKPMFTVRKGSYMMAADYAAIEPRLIAVWSGEESLLNAYAKGLDVHSLNAEVLFGVKQADTEPALWKKKFRHPAKTFGLGAAYNKLDIKACAQTIMLQIHKDFPEMKLEHYIAATERYFDARPNLWKWKQDIYAKAKENDYVECYLSGRRRYFWGKVEDTEVFNHPNQAAVAYLIDRAMRDICNNLDWNHSWMLLQRHDELIFETPEPERMKELFHQYMETTVELNGYSVDCIIEGQIGTHWGELENW